MGASLSSKKKEEKPPGTGENDAPKSPSKGGKEAIINKVVDIFQKFDKNSDGVISRQELIQVLMSLNFYKFRQEDCDLVLDIADKDRNGSICYKEFVMWVFDLNAAEVATAPPVTPGRRIAMDYTTLLPERWEVDISKRYTLDRTTLGEGGYGKVFVAKDREFQDSIVVVKKVTKTHDKSRTELFRREIQIMKELDHPNICKLMGTFEEGNSIYYVMEYLEGGEVFDRIISEGKISEQLTATIVGQVASAIRYAHSKGVAHRDIKPENVVFCTKKGDLVKLIDWGLGMSFTGCAMRESVGSTTYTAPEVMDSGNVRAYNETCDLWSMGVLTYVMLCGRPPFWGSQKTHLERARAERYPFTGEVWDSVSPEGKDFIKELLRADPQNRRPISEVVAHPWLTMNEWPPPQSNIEAGVLANMRQFSNTSTFSAMCIAAVARQLDHKKLNNIHQVFRSMDKNGDGVLSLEEIAEGFKKLYGEDSEEYKVAYETFRGLDLNGSDVIDYTEFCAGGLGQHTVLQEEACWAAFKTFDMDNTGNISKNELKKVLEHTDLKGLWSEDVCTDVADQVLMKHDADGDGMINFTEFMAMMRASRDRNDPLYAAGADTPAASSEDGARLVAYDLLLQMSALR